MALKSWYVPMTHNLHTTFLSYAEYWSLTHIIVWQWLIICTQRFWHMRNIGCWHTSLCALTNNLHTTFLSYAEYWSLTHIVVWQWLIICTQHFCHMPRILFVGTLRCVAMTSNLHMTFLAYAEYWLLAHIVVCHN